MSTAATTTVAFELPAEISELVLSAARGSYQTQLLNGQARWSGSDLQGNARKFGARYAKSRAALVETINARLAGTGWTAQTEISMNRRELVLRHTDGHVHVW